MLPDRETALYFSISARPGTFGTRFHNYLFREHKMNALYMSRAVQSIEKAIAGIREFDVKGCAVSMPFKVEALKYVDQMDVSAKSVGALNTILNKDGVLTGFNTDTMAVEEVVKAQELGKKDPVLVLGAGGMARGVLGAFNRMGFSNVQVMARNESSARTLAGEFGFLGLPWSEKTERRRVIVNSTSLGFKEPGDSVPNALKFALSGADEIWDMVGDPAETALVRNATKAGLKTVAGILITKLQAVHQFKIYTGVTPDEKIVDAAFKFATS